LAVVAALGEHTSHKYRVIIEGKEFVTDVVEQGKNDYLITLDGRTYATHIEDASDAGGPAPRPVVKTAPTAGERSSRPTVPPIISSAVDTQGRIQILAPLTGTISSIKVASGASVQQGQLLCLLEAMKMEIEIFANQGGKVFMVAVGPAQTVQQGALLFVLEIEGHSEL
jgi:biotin carboxyl carrier protein